MPWHDRTRVGRAAGIILSTLAGQLSTHPASHRKESTTLGRVAGNRECFQKQGRMPWLLRYM